MRETALWPIAFHGAGHAVAAWSRGIKVKSATIVPARDFLGQVTHVSPLRGVRLDCDDFQSRSPASRSRGCRAPRRSCRAATLQPRSPSNYGLHDQEYAVDLARQLNGYDQAGAEAHLNWLAIVARDEIDASWDPDRRGRCDAFRNDAR